MTATVNTHGVIIMCSICKNPDGCPLRSVEGDQVSCPDDMWSLRNVTPRQMLEKIQIETAANE